MTSGLLSDVVPLRGLKFVAKDRPQRIRGIANELANSDYDIVCLQELWVHADFQYIRNQVSKVLPNAKFFYSGALGSGLAIFTRFPILETSIRPYSLNGSPLDVAGGDFFVGKCIVSAVFHHDALGEVEIFNTHVSLPHNVAFVHHGLILIDLAT